MIPPIGQIIIRYHPNAPPTYDYVRQKYTPERQGVLVWAFTDTEFNDEMWAEVWFLSRANAKVNEGDLVFSP